MAQVANDGTLVRGSITTTISNVVYTWLDFSRSAAARSEFDYDVNGKPAAATHVEDFEHLSGTIRTRSDQVAPPKFVVFSYDSKNWYIMSREETGSTEGLKQYAVEAIECISGTVTLS